MYTQPGKEFSTHYKKNQPAEEPPDYQVNHTLRTLYPNIRDRDDHHLIPRRWDVQQASSYLEISANGLTASFKKNVSLQGDKDPSGVVRANLPIPRNVGLYYFEVEIIHGVRGCMGVGLSKGNGDLNRMPGWDAHCFGYHGDDGNFFSACGHGTSYGPKFGTGDVIGCGIDTMTFQVFFTKNGKHLGIAFRGKEPFEELYPTVGLKTQGEQLNVNFGYKSFMFDLINYREHVYKEKTHLIDNVPIPKNILGYMDKTIISFLAHSGQLETIKKFEEILGVKEKSDYEFLRKRKEIQQLIISAARGAEIQAKIDEYFPSLLESNPRAQLILLCLRFIDLATSLKEPPNLMKKNEDGVLSRGKGGKSQKRTRPDRSRSQPKKAVQPENSESLKDEDTGEELMKIDDVVISKKMYNDLSTEEEYSKVVYLIKMGREINSLSKSFTLTEKDRTILEASITIILNSNPIEQHPLKSGDFRYISNMITEIINNLDVNLEEGDTMDEFASKKVKFFSQLRDMFIGWRGLHEDAYKRNHHASGLDFIRNVLFPPSEPFAMIPVEYNEEPIEKEEEEEEVIEEEQATDF